MKGLLKKDFYFLLEAKSQFLIMIIAIIAAILLAGKNPNFSTSFVSSYILVICSMRAVSTIAYDEDNNGLSYLMTMAITRKTYVTSKYMLALLISLGTGIIIAIITTAIEIISAQTTVNGENNSPISLFYILKMMVLMQVIITCVSLLLNSVFLPSYFKYGTKKGALVSTLWLFIFCIIIIFLSIAFSDTLNTEHLLNKMTNITLINISTLFMGITIICILISYALSQKIMKAKDF